MWAATSSELVKMPEREGFPMRLTALVLATGLLWPASDFFAGASNNVPNGQ